MTKKKPDKQKQSNLFIKYSSLGFEMMAIMVGFTLLGHKIDYWLGNETKGFTLGLLIISVLIALMYGTRSMLKKPDDKK